jgi:L-fuculose-phosphate aldolase
MSLFDTYAEEITAFTKVTGRLAANMYVTGYGGNAAWRLEEDLILITPTMMNKGDITKDDVVFIDMAGKTVAGTRRPTGERPMYIKFFNDRPDIKSVIHCHAPNVGAFAIMHGSNLLMRPFFPETSHEVGPVPVVPYGETLTQQLADNFEPFIRKYNSFIMENHGLVTMTRGDMYWTLLTVELFESTVDSMLRALAAGSLKELSREAVRDLSEIMRIRDLPLFGAPGVNTSLEKLYFP